MELLPAVNPRLETCHCCRAEDLLTALPTGSIDLIVTSPPLHFTVEYATIPPYNNQYGGVVMPQYTCKNCGKTFTRRGKRGGVFCSLGCKGQWQRNQKAYDRDWLYQKYVVDGLSTYQIAKLVDRNPKQIYQWLKGYEIPTREREWDTTGHQPFHDKEWLIKEYVEKKRSTGEIAAEFGVNEPAIIHFMRKHGIKRRTTSEARAVKYWGQEGENNPMYGKRAANWRGGVTPERQALYSSPEWSKAVKAVWKRDNGYCQRCGVRAHDTDAMHIHHIVSFANRKLRTEPSNLILVCQKCHRWIHSKKNISHEFLRDE